MSQKAAIRARKRASNDYKDLPWQRRPRYKRRSADVAKRLISLKIMREQARRARGAKF